jgi:hypothetical protein
MHAQPQRICMHTKHRLPDPISNTVPLTGDNIRLVIVDHDASFAALRAFSTVTLTLFCDHTQALMTASQCKCSHQSPVACTMVCAGMLASKTLYHPCMLHLRFSTLPQNYMAVGPPSKPVERRFTAAPMLLVFHARRRSPH